MPRLRELAADPRLVPVAAVSGLLCAGGFWVLTAVAASRQPGYDATRDYVSSLASTGAQQPWLGVLAIALLGCSYLAAGHVLLWRLRAVASAALAAAAGAVVLLVAVARIDCPGGSARCGLDNDPVAYLRAVDEASWGQVVHGPAVVASAVLLVAAMIALAAVLPRRCPTAYVSIGCAVVAAVSPLFWVPSDSPGLGQRVWLAALSGWILWVCALPLTERRSRDLG